MIERAFLDSHSMLETNLHVSQRSKQLSHYRYVKSNILLHHYE
jgi:hypothetical protein